MNNIFVYCEITEEGTIADVSLELISKGRKLADILNVKLEAVVITDKIENIENQLYPYGVDVINLATGKGLFPYTTLPHFAIVVKLFEEKKPEIALFGATSVGRDLAPRVASRLRCGLTADCTALEIGDHTENRTGKEYKDLLYQIRPAFGGNIIATIINPETRPQMATVREGVMKKETYCADHQGIVNQLKLEDYVTQDDFVLKIVKREIEQQKINIKGAGIIVSGGYGMGSQENFKMLFELAGKIGGEVGATRAAVDAGFTEHERQVGQTGVTVRPKLYIACGISGAVQHRAGMDESAKIISINTDPNAPINAIADYTIIGDVKEVLPRMIKAFDR
ncbi:electron transfer flavoprotein subunit alpha/FixB family protein [Bacteroidales bacterium OttesenSCG-928-C03]|nr:electron transfer flavoprotein subunit alpha/FixB family protein [Bacteroidales bacterium OttesenSCG-928-C03]MDL2326770.1 electron transfer flavoprotein subunit alpha/FixB family protein [Bacteroidales bacterium OttesenSCG-928-A14]